MTHLKAFSLIAVLIISLSPQTIGQVSLTKQLELAKTKLLLQKADLSKTSILKTYSELNKNSSSLQYEHDSLYHTELLKMLSLQRQAFIRDLDTKAATDRLTQVYNYLQDRYPPLKGQSRKSPLSWLSQDYDKLKNIDTTLHFIANYDFATTLSHKLNAYTGEAKVGMTINNAEKVQQTQANIGFDLRKGIYPGEFKMSGGLNFVQTENKLAETISNVAISYDRNITAPGDNPLRWEAYTFINRYSNTFIDLQQRWEAGFGMIANWYSDELLLAGEKNAKKLNQASSLLETEGNQEAICQCLDEVAGSDMLSQLVSKSNLDQAKKELGRVKLANKKKYSKLRAGLLMGVFTEIEQYISSGDSLTLQLSEDLDTTVLNQVSYASTPLYRFVTRPFFEWQFAPGSRLSFKPYLIWSIPYLKGQERAISASAEEQTGPDLRWDIQTSLSIKLSPVAKISVSVRYIKDYLPPGVYVDIVDITGNQILVTPQDRHLMSEFSFGYTFR